MERASTDAEEQGRADLYALLARLLFAPPDAYLLQQLAAAPVRMGSSQPLEVAWAALTRGCATTHAADATAEFDALFVSIDAPRINPFASLYLTGFLNEKPLVALRDDLARLGLARRHGAGEMEDHMGALCEAMRVLIVGSGIRQPQSVEVQRAFFEAHLASWYASCLNELRSVPEARFYRLVADLAEAFFDVEALAFELEASSWN